MKNLGIPVKALLILLGVMAVLLSIHLSLQHLNLAHNEKHGQIFELSNRFDVDDEASVPTWFSQAVWIGVAACSALAAGLSRDKKTRRLWAIMVAIGIVFSIDEVSGLHELSLQSLHLLFFGLEQSSSQLNAWWLVLPLVLIFGLWFLRKLFTILGTKQWLLMIIGWALFMAGAVGFELYGNDIAHNTFLYQGWVVAAEEGLEMLGGIVVLYVILDYLDSNYSAQIKRTWRQLRAKE